MKPIVVSSLMFLGGFAGAAMAECTSPPLTNSQITAAFSGKLVCGAPSAGYPGGASSPDRWQEEHLANGQLWDYKKGPGDPVDPRKQVGRWSVANNQISHNYIGGAVYTWNVHGGAGSRYFFCVGSVQHVQSVAIANTGVGCQGVFPL